MRKVRGFTLIELLVVIAIIALLVSILVPSLSRVKELAKRSVCGANLHSMGQSMALYSVRGSAGNTGLYPNAETTGTSPNCIGSYVTEVREALDGSGNSRSLYLM